MRFGPVVVGVCAVMICGSSKPCPTVSQTATAPAEKTEKVAAAIPLILKKDEGERQVVRGWPGHPNPGETFTLKVDPTNGGSQRTRRVDCVHPCRHVDLCVQHRA